MQQIAIIASSKDPAGINIRNNLIQLFNFESIDENFDNNAVFQFNEIQNKKIKLYLINDDLIFAENIDKKISADFFIFASKHRSKENKPSFTVHPIGNWDKSEFGGQEKKLCLSSAVLIKNLYLSLMQNSHFLQENANIEVSLEVTHHGPYVEKPAVFIEIGSTEREWNEKINGEIIAKTIMKALENENKNYRIAVGIGGPHYCSNFNKIILKTDIAISHICPKYLLEQLGEDLIKQSIEKTVEKVDFGLLDWKGLGAEKQRIIDVLKKIDLEFKRTDWI